MVRQVAAQRSERRHGRQEVTQPQCTEHEGAGPRAGGAPAARRTGACAGLSAFRAFRACAAFGAFGACAGFGAFRVPAHAFPFTAP
ncbi:hypothetical protein [Streptomyces sp. LARHCF249]